VDLPLAGDAGVRRATSEDGCDWRAFAAIPGDMRQHRALLALCDGALIGHRPASRPILQPFWRLIRSRPVDGQMPI
jgi:hypothetical protein